MAYDPFARGPYPAGVRTLRVHDAARDRTLSVELWYPATDAHAGQDTAEATRDQYELLPGLPAVAQDAVRDATIRPGRHPLVLFSHGYGAHRRQSTFLTTHLASHGYVVAGIDHPGNTLWDVMQAAFRAQMHGEIPDLTGSVTASADLRPADVLFVLEHVLATLGPRVDPERIGMSGHSFGGWTTLAVTAREPRIRAALPLAPAGGEGLAETDPLARALAFEWGRDVPTLYVVADQDSLLPLRTMHSLFERTRGRRRMVVLRDTDHMHFCDRAAEAHEMFRSMPGVVPELQRLAPAMRPFSELAAEEPTLAAIRGLGLAHMDAALAAHERAAAWLASDVAAALAARGVAADVA